MNYRTLAGRKKRRQTNDDDRVMPLINIVFLLLVFFMVTGRLSGSDPFSVVPPQSKTDESLTAETRTILIGADNELALDGQIIRQKDLLSALNAKNTHNIRVKSDANASAAFVVLLVEQLRERGIDSIRLLTIRNSAGKS